MSIFSALELRNSIMRIVKFYDKVSDVFNDVIFVLESQCLPDLHSDFVE